MWEKFGLWVGIVASVVTLVVFVLEYGPKIWGAKAMLGTAYPKISAILLVLAFALSAFSIYLWTANRPPDVQKPLSPVTQTIYGQTYINQEVEVDGKKFDHCHFENVTFFLHGKASWEFNESTLNGKIGLRTDNRAISSFNDLSGLIQKHPGVTGFQAFGIDEHGNLKPIGPRIERK